VKTYLVLWNENNKLELNVFVSYKEAKNYKKFISKNKKPKIVKLKYGVAEW
jgi:hypothetical protein